MIGFFPSMLGILIYFRKQFFGELIPLLYWSRLYGPLVISIHWMKYFSTLRHVCFQLSVCWNPRYENRTPVRAWVVCSARALILCVNLLFSIYRVLAARIDIIWIVNVDSSMRTQRSAVAQWIEFQTANQAARFRIPANTNGCFLKYFCDSW